MKQIPYCPPNMGNANDWIEAREALGFPQNRTVSYEYTTYDNSGSDTVEEIERRYKEEDEYGEEMFKIGFEWGYKQAIEDLKKIKSTDHSADSVKKILKKVKCPLSIRSRFYEIKSIVRINEKNDKKS